MSLDEYERKRKFDQTPEPGREGKPSKAAGRRFCLQRHDARRLHYDLRLELGGTLKSWALPKGPSLAALDKRLAVPTEDHPLMYLEWEGVIPEKQYGAGLMMVFDIGDWDPVEEGDPEAQLAAGELKLRLWGKKVQGEWTLVRTSVDAWLFIKKDDPWCQPEWDPEQHLWSAVSGRTPGEIAAGEPAPRAPVDLWPTGAVKSALPLEIDPMLAEPGKPFDDEDWLFELKWDGIRALAFCEEQSLRMVGRRGRSLLGSFPELRFLRAHLAARSFLLDGELVVLDQDGKPDFSRVLSRMQAPSSRALARSARVDKAVYYVFDLLHLDGRDLRAVPFEVRRALLDQVFRPDPWVRLSEAVAGVGKALFALSLERGLEGLVAKRRSGTYDAGRSPNWLKVKARHTADVVVVGYTASNAKAPFGALQIARWGENGLVSVGKVGSGFGAADHAEVFAALQPSRQAPRVKGLEKPREEIFWVEPRLVVEIEFQDQTKDGIFRHSSYLRMRDDLRPEDCCDHPEPVTAAFMEVDGRTLSISNPHKVLFPKSGFRKQDLVDYYDRMARFVLAHTSGRPLSVRRYPDGVEGPEFFQKHPGPGTPDWVSTLSHPERGELLLVQDRASLIHLANLACVELHVTFSRVPHLDMPDGFVLDFDPQDAPFALVKKLARSAGEILDELGWSGRVKTSGSRGIHIFVPLAPGYNFEQSRMVASVVAEILLARHPRESTLERAPGKRPRNTIYIDTPQNRSAATMAAAYSVRATAHASWSAPLRWEDLETDVDPRDFTIADSLTRVSEVGDLWSMEPDPRHRLEKALPKLEQMLKKK